MVYTVRRAVATQVTASVDPGSTRTLERDANTQPVTNALLNCRVGAPLFPHNRGGAYATHSHHASRSCVFGSLTASGSVTPECVQLKARSLHVCNIHGCKCVVCWARGSITVATHRADWQLCIGPAQSDRLRCALEQGARALSLRVGAPKCEMWCIMSHTWVQCMACRCHTNVTCPRIGIPV